MKGKNVSQKKWLREGNFKLFLFNGNVVEIMASGRCLIYVSHLGTSEGNKGMFAHGKSPHRHGISLSVQTSRLFSSSPYASGLRKSYERNYYARFYLVSYIKSFFIVCFPGKARYCLQGEQKLTHTT